MPVAKFADIEEVRRGGYFKYVRMDDDSFRFVAIGGPFAPKHRDMVDKNETAKGAGGVIIEPPYCGSSGGANIVMRGSMTLKLPTLEGDEHMIAIAVFGPERR